MFAGRLVGWLVGCLSAVQSIWSVYLRPLIYLDCVIWPGVCFLIPPSQLDIFYYYYYCLRPVGILLT